MQQIYENNSLWWWGTKNRFLRKEFSKLGHNFGFYNFVEFSQSCPEMM